jgi:hypothetical protein
LRGTRDQVAVRFDRRTHAPCQPLGIEASSRWV